jgi:hypothetical protein
LSSYSPTSVTTSRSAASFVCATCSKVASADLSPGRNNSERIVASKVSIPEGRACIRRAKAE